MTENRIYAVGDLHGYDTQLSHVLELIERDGGRDAEIVFLGDLVDRGPDSRTVVDRLMTGIDAGRNWHVIKGNHDRMFTRFVRDGRTDDPRILSGLLWLNPRLGGVQTLESYGVSNAGDRDAADLWRDARECVPENHVRFLENLPLWHRNGPLLFVHAGIAPGVSLEDQDDDDLIWIRQPFLEYQGTHPYLIVHGHTALEHPEHAGNRINLDGGGGYGRPVYPAVFEGDACWLLKESGREPLPPPARRGLLSALLKR